MDPSQVDSKKAPTGNELESRPGFADGGGGVHVQFEFISGEPIDRSLHHFQTPSRLVSGLMAKARARAHTQEAVMSITSFPATEEMPALE